MTLIKDEFDAFRLLKNSYGASTRRTNHFKSAIDRIRWDSVFSVDDEIYLNAEKFVLIIDNLDPFEEKRKPSIIFCDGSMVTL